MSVSDENTVLNTSLETASIQNEVLRLDYLTTTGPRIIGLYTNGSNENLLAETPEVHWQTPHGEYYLRGGHRLWTAPEDPFYTCPEDGLDVVEESGKVMLKSPVDASGLQKEISIRLEKNCVHLSHRVTWHGEGPIRMAPWAITQLKLGGMAILPLAHLDGLLPDRNLVFWPYASMQDERLDLHDDQILLFGREKAQAFKIGNLNSHGWVAYALGNLLFTKRFATGVQGDYPDLGCNVEAYVKDVCVELETLGALKTLNYGDSTTFEETWEIITGDFPPTMKTARDAKKQLSQSTLTE